MTGWQWFWTLIGYIVFIIVLIFLYFYEPFEVLFTQVINGISFSNLIFWVSAITGIVGFVVYHWHAYRVHIVQQASVESMVLSSLRGSTFTAIVLSAGATLQAVQMLTVYLLERGYSLHSEFGERLAALASLAILTGIFYIIYWLLSYIGAGRQTA